MENVENMEKRDGVWGYAPEISMFYMFSMAKNRGR